MKIKSKYLLSGVDVHEVDSLEVVVFSASKIEDLRGSLHFLSNIHAESPSSSVMKRGLLGAEGFATSGESPVNCSKPGKIMFRKAD